ncbi:MAG: (Fe-S)-binding protein, partial [Planctomycetaceae bacterium]
PREILRHTQATYQLVDLRRSGTQTACCGAGGGRMWLDDSIDQRVGRSRVDEVLSNQADVVAVSCPFCLTMLTDGLAAQGAKTEVVDIAELLVSVIEEPGTPPETKS